MRYRWLAIVVLLFLLLPPDLLAQGCSMCKAVAEQSQDGGGGAAFGGNQSIGNGLNAGIIVLMVVPYALLFLFFRKRILGFFKEFASAQG